MSPEDQKNYEELAEKLNKIDHSYKIDGLGLHYVFDIPAVGTGYFIRLYRAKYKGKYNYNGTPVKHAIRIIAPFIKFRTSHMRDDFDTLNPEKIHTQVLKAKRQVVSHQIAYKKIKDEGEQNVLHVTNILKNIEVDVTTTQRMSYFLTVKMKDRSRDAEKLFDILISKYPYGMSYKLGFSEVEMSEPLFVEIAEKLYREHQLNVIRRKLS